MSIPFPCLSVLRPLLPLLVLLIANPAFAETVRLRMDAGLDATAEWYSGDADHKPILILHGFLQTRDFFTVKRLAEALIDEGYPVLLPNLTLGITLRRQSLACEAIHTDSMEQDVREIETWATWLHEKTARPVTLIGHSAGSLMLLAYLYSEPQTPISQTLLISLIAFAQGPIAKETAADRLKALAQLSIDPDGMYRYPLAFCDTYFTTPRNYISYLNWDEKKTLNCLNKLSFRPTVILGSEDLRLGKDWMPRLKQSGAEVIEIEGANHFFNNQAEFDLMDTISELLKRTNP
jgi:pimeloyl-ACP methyl ester carboxylesterase